MSFKTWTEEHQAIWEFIKFNVLSNISTITRLVCAAGGAALFVNTMPPHCLRLKHQSSNRR